MVLYHTHSHQLSMCKQSDAPTHKTTQNLMSKTSPMKFCMEADKQTPRPTSTSTDPISPRYANNLVHSPKPFQVYLKIGRP
jgi:hypothetical protein